MINDFLKYGAAVGLVTSFICFILVKSNIFTESFVVIYDKVYNFSKIISFFFILTISKFINEKFNLIFKISGLVFSVILIVNIFKELNVFQIGNMQMFIMILSGLPVIMYFDFFRKKAHKNYLDILKITFLISFLINGFLEINEFSYTLMMVTTQILFWSTILGCLFDELHKDKQNALN